ncbi:hypothetical protein [Desertibacillus haloalkaliphilus]|nr:hypothetical protein [Desertibacillus haloalkaliphilus]
MKRRPTVHSSTTKQVLHNGKPVRNKPTQSKPKTNGCCGKRLYKK